jgi:uncharacterized membrane-anchored protein YhcB (DUF1043 family)
LVEQMQELVQHGENLDTYSEDVSERLHQAAEVLANVETEAEKIEQAVRQTAVILEGSS